jgi:predicted MFS family arabinose efflux permease
LAPARPGSARGRRTILGVLVTVQGIGVLFGALVAGRLLTRLGEIAVWAIGLLTFAAAIAIAITPPLPLAVVAMPFSGAGSILIGVAFIRYSGSARRRL